MTRGNGDCDSSVRRVLPVPAPAPLTSSFTRAGRNANPEIDAPAPLSRGQLSWAPGEWAPLSAAKVVPAPVPAPAPAALSVDSATGTCALPLGTLVVSVKGLGSRVKASGCWVSDLGLRILGFGFRVYDLGFRV